MKEMGISPSNILCVTFTNKAANEMKKRIRTVLGGDESLGLVKKAPSTEFAEGDRVVHKIFGEGLVKAVDEKNFCYEIAFEKFATPHSIQFDFPLTRA